MGQQFLSDPRSNRVARFGRVAAGATNLPAAAEGAVDVDQTGRDFSLEDARVQPQPQPGQAASAPRLPLVAIMSDGLWKRRFGGNPAIVGTSVELGNNRALVVGILKPGLELLFPAAANIERQPDL